MTVLLHPAVLAAGFAALAAGLYLLQRLRVRHREVEVVTTLFWREAVEERSVRVLKRRFRHPWAYLLLLAIAGFLWALVASPARTDADGTRHVVLLDGAAAMSRDGRFERAVAAATDLAAALPVNRREVRLVAGEVETVLAPGEPLPLLRARLDGRVPVAAPGGFSGALTALAAGADERTPVHAYLVGDAPVEREQLDHLPETVTIERVPIDGALAANRGIVEIGLADGDLGAWETVDVTFEVAPAEADVPADALAITLDDAPLGLPLERRGPGRFRLRDVPARGGVLTVRFVDAAYGGSIAFDDVASIALPNRPRITVRLDPSAPNALRSVLRLDPGLRLVDDSGGANAEVVIGAGDGADLQLVDDQAADAFTITMIDRDDGDDAMRVTAIIDELALRQIDADTLAEQAGREIRLTIDAGATRRVTMWSALLESPYDFRDSRAFPVFIARSVRWLAGRPALVPWARTDEPVPSREPLVVRPARVGAVPLADGRIVQASLLERAPGAGAKTDGPAVTAAEGRGLDLFGLLGLIIAALLAVEWVLYQRGRIP